MMYDDKVTPRDLARQLPLTEKGIRRCLRKWWREDGVEHILNERWKLSQEQANAFKKYYHDKKARR